jgi:hypothetical protein
MKCMYVILFQIIHVSALKGGVHDTENHASADGWEQRSAGHERWLTNRNVIC